MRLSRTIPIAACVAGCTADPDVGGGYYGTPSSSSGTAVDASSQGATEHGSTTEGTMDGSSTDASSSTGFSSDPFPPPPPLDRPSCGDGNVDPDEECDDGNDVDRDACTNTCVLRSSILVDVQLDSEGPGCLTSAAAYPSGDLVVAGFVVLPDRERDPWVGRVTASGELSWSRSWTGTDAIDSELVEAIAVDAVGNAYALARLKLESFGAYLYKFDEEGMLQWDVAVSAEPGASNSPEDLITTAEGTTTVLTGHFGEPDGARLMRFDTDGAPAWPQAIDAGGVRHAAMEVHHAPADDLTLISVIGTATDYRPRIERRAADGTIVWTRTPTPPMGFPGVAIAAVAPDGSVSVVSTDYFDRELLVVRSWSAQGDGPQTGVPGYDQSLSLEEAVYGPDGDLYVIGNGSDENGRRGWLLRIDPRGEMVWGRRHEGRVNALVVTDTGDIVVAGCRDDDEALWLRRYEG